MEPTWAQVGPHANSKGDMADPRRDPVFTGISRALVGLDGAEAAAKLAITFLHNVQLKIYLHRPGPNFKPNLHLRHNLSPNAPELRHVGPKLGPVWSQVVQTGPKFGPNWAQVDACSAQLKASMAKFGLGPSRLKFNPHLQLSYLYSTSKSPPRRAQFPCPWRSVDGDRGGARRGRLEH